MDHMSKETYIRAILESNFAGFKDEIIDIAVKKIMEYDTETITCMNCKHWNPSEKICSHLSTERGWLEDDEYAVYTEENFYCKDAEKEGEENNEQNNQCR